MPHLPILSIAAVSLVVLTPAPAVQAQQGSHTNSASYSRSQCDVAKAWLVAKHGEINSQADIAQSEKYYAIWSSPECVAYRQPRAFNVAPEIRATAALLKDNGIDIEARMPAKIADCRAKTPAAWLAMSPAERAERSAEEMMETCVLNARTDLYAEGLNELNEKRQRTYAEKTAEYERKLRERDAKIAENKRIVKEQEDRVAAVKAENERKMAAWREAVALCKKGKREYCAK